MITAIRIAEVIIIYVNILFSIKSHISISRTGTLSTGSQGGYCRIRRFIKTGMVRCVLRGESHATNLSGSECWWFEGKPLNLILTREQGHWGVGRFSDPTLLWHPYKRQREKYLRKYLKNIYFHYEHRNTVILKSWNF